MRPADNPFASRCIDGLEFRFADRNRQDLLDRLDRGGRRGAIIGPHGSGKTTLVEDLAGHLEGEIVRVRLNSGIDRPVAAVLAALTRRIGPEHTILIDGAEQLGPWSWWRIRWLTRHAGTIVITSHSPGRLPTIHECTTDPALLQKLVVELAPEVADSTDLDEIFNRHNGNLRLCFRELYDRCAGIGAAPTFWAADGVPVSRDQFG